MNNPSWETYAESRQYKYKSIRWIYSKLAMKTWRHCPFWKLEKLKMVDNESTSLCLKSETPESHHSILIND